ncbi:MAG: universal stress protein [Flavobacteriaceae bacterium]
MVFRKVLIGFAFSPNLKANIFEAARLALQFDAEIIFLHVGEKTTQKEQEFEQLLASLPKGPKKQSVVWKVGSPNDVIVATCEKEKVDLLLLGALKRENMLRYYLGSIARKVTRKAPCSVLLMLHPSVERIPCQHMVVNGFDSPHTQHTVEKAYEVAQALKTQKITLVEEINRSEIKIAVSDDRSLRQATLRKQKLNRQEERRVQDILKEIPETKKQGVKTQSQSIFGRRGYSIGHYARLMRADLLVMNAQEESRFWHRLFPKDLEHILNELPTNVLIIAPEPHE